MKKKHLKPYSVNPSAKCPLPTTLAVIAHARLAELKRAISDTSAFHETVEAARHLVIAADRLPSQE